jgi:hypothetical protein
MNGCRDYNIGEWDRRTEAYGVIPAQSWREMPVA